MEKHLINKYSAPVPRYTSYPTAPHFKVGITQSVFKGWLQAIDSKTPISLYLHIPFCQELCWFCGCNTKITKQYTPIKNYVALLLKEIELVSHTLGERVDVSHIHWGGGSPTLLKPEDFTEIMTMLRSKFNVLPGAEIAVEIDPRTLSADLVDAFGAAGVTRTSLGVQDFNLDVQKAINRYQPFDMVQKAVASLKGAGIAAINFDLIYGLPNQSVANVIETVKLAVKLDPDRLSVFGYAHVPWMKTHMRLIDEKMLPDAQARYVQSQAMTEALTRAGYCHIGLDHFAKPQDSLTRAAKAGDLKRNFQGYTTDSAAGLIGLGVSSISNLPTGYVQNHSSMHQYAAAIEAGEFALSRGVKLQQSDSLDRTIIERLMCDLRVDITIARLAGDIPYAALWRLEQDGLIEITPETIEITPKGRPFMRHVCAVFDKYLTGKKKQHSMAI
jgi:oxygen-independent coproporphyrinogen-3 oxidase